MKRREFLFAGAAGSLLACAPRILTAQASSSFELTLDLSGNGRPIPASFTGLSYEKAQLADPLFFSATNHDLVGLLKRLGSEGVLRIGGNTSDFAIWTEHNAVLSPQAANAPVGPDAGLNIDKTTQITPRSVDELRTLLDATGWRVIYGLDLGHGDPGRAAAEAAYAVEKLGNKLIVLQIGNEPDLFYRNGVRSPSYGYADYIQEWKRYAAAILGRTPGAPLGGPDIGNHPAWVDSFAHDVPNAKLLTSHFYAEGPPSDPNANIARMLRPHPKNEAIMKQMVSLSEQVSIPYRMAEGNSCYHGGKDGVSNSFASALWGADYMLSLAQWEVTGVNFHGGGQGFYTPIAGGGSQPLVARPLYYGMLFFEQFAHGSLYPVIGVTDTLRAYAAVDKSRHVRIALLNLDGDNDLDITLHLPSAARNFDTMALTAPAMESLTGVTLGGSFVAKDGAWRPTQSGVVRSRSGVVPIHLTKAQGLILSSRGPLRA